MDDDDPDFRKIIDEIPKNIAAPPEMVKAKIKSLIDRNPNLNLNARNRYGQSVLKHLNNQQLFYAAKYLMDVGADPFLEDGSGKSLYPLVQQYRDSMSRYARDYPGYTEFLATIDQLKKLHDQRSAPAAGGSRKHRVRRSRKIKRHRTLRSRMRGRR